MNMVPNCSITSSPLSTSWLVERIVTHVPARAACTPYKPASVESVVPGTSGRWNRMSWRAWSSIGICSAGMTSWRAAIIGSHDGITENTGGASRPEAYAGLASLVASRYARTCSGSTNAVVEWREPSVSKGTGIVA